MVIQIALDHTLLAHNHTKGLGSMCKDVREKGAWADCMTLFDSTIFELNRTLNPTKKDCYEFDKQTWLSTALTNLETCIAGFKPYISNNVTKLISNSLAMHNNAVPETQSYKLGFPTWVTRRDRNLLQASKLATANLVVAQDGLGDFKTIREALDAAAKKSRSGRFVIHIKSGVYAEYLVIGTNLRNIMLVGDGMQSTIITGDRSYGDGFTIFNSATVAVTGDGFIARGITFRNTAGPENNQAVALRVGSDHSIFHQCSFEGYQDTLFAHSQRQFYRECNIYGTIDFIFGNAASIFQKCNIIVRKPLTSQKNTVTAQGRTDPNQNTGIIIQNSRITASPDLKPVIASFPSFLGRPWEQYSRTVVVESFIDSLISPVGWLEWDGNFALDTLFYAEYNNFGPGSLTGKRVKWKGYKIITNVDQISQFFVANFIGGESWIPAASVPFTSGI
uniref:Pectinesterase n=2 Tax=Chenopodium quinoa TaxID=63459 RepID=A0A803KT32_CHEQI